MREDITAGVCKQFQALPCLPGEPGGCGPIPMRHCCRANLSATGFTEKVTGEASLAANNCATGFAEKVTGEESLAANNCNFKFFNTAKKLEYHKHRLLSKTQVAQIRI